MRLSMRMLPNTSPGSKRPRARDRGQRRGSQATTRYKLVTSEGVVAELQEGEYQAQVAAVDLVADLPRLDVVDEIADKQKPAPPGHLPLGSSC